MHKEVFSGKTLEEAKILALESLNVSEEDVIFIEKSEKKSLFSKKAEIEVIKKADVIEYIKEIVSNIINTIGLEVKMETKNRHDTLTLNVLSSNNEILIGKGGKNLSALKTIVNQAIKLELGNYFPFQLDVADYQQNRERRLEKLAKYTARDAARGNCEIKLDPMNAYDRRIIHNTLTNSKDVYTESFGEEPNRYVVIKPKEN